MKPKYVKKYFKIFDETLEFPQLTKRLLCFPENIFMTTRAPSEVVPLELTAIR